MVPRQTYKKRIKEGRDLLSEKSWAFEQDRRYSCKRVALICIAMREQNEECLKLMAGQFEQIRSEFANFIYWEPRDIREVTMRMSDANMGRGDRESVCVVM